MKKLGYGLFTVASAACGLAGTPAELIVARFAQGLGAALMVPQVLALITALFPPAERHRALAWFGVTVGLGAIAGQVLGILPTSDSGLRNSDNREKNALSALVETEIVRRKEARARKDFAQSDIIRDDLAKAGIILEDSKEGTNWSLK